MFTQIAQLAKHSTLNLIISAEGDNLRVIVMPKPKGGENAALSTPLSLLASPEELDREFASVINGYSANRTTLQESLDAAKTIMDAAAKEAREKAASKAKPAASKTAAKPASTNLMQEEDDGLGDNDAESADCGTPAATIATIATKPATESVELSLF